MVVNGLVSVSAVDTMAPSEARPVELRAGTGGYSVEPLFALNARQENALTPNCCARKSAGWL